MNKVETEHTEVDNKPIVIESKKTVQSSLTSIILTDLSARPLSTVAELEEEEEELPVEQRKESSPKNALETAFIEEVSAQIDSLAILNNLNSASSGISFNKSKVDFIWFAKKATLDRKSYAHTELYYLLLKMFLMADVNKDGLVSRASFPMLFNMASTIPRIYGYAPDESELYRTGQEKEEAMQNAFDSMDIEATGVIKFNEWYQHCMEHIIAKNETLEPHPLIDDCNKLQFMSFVKNALLPGSVENNELYRFLKEVFTEHDREKNGTVDMGEISAMINEVLKIPRKLEIAHPYKVSVMILSLF